MNINKLRNVIQTIPSISISSIKDLHRGNEFIFGQTIKNILPTTNFELLGEHLVVGNESTIGKCDMWLVNIPNNFLLSLELKTGKDNDINKQKILKTQMFKYTNLMQLYFPENTVYGIGVYKCIESGKDPIFFQSTKKHIYELEFLKNLLKTNTNYSFE